MALLYHPSFHLFISSSSFFYFLHPLTSSFSYCIHCLPSPNPSSHLSTSPSLLLLFAVSSLRRLLTRIASPPVRALFANHPARPPFCSSKRRFDPSSHASIPPVDLLSLVFGPLSLQVGPSSHLDSPFSTDLLPFYYFVVSHLARWP